ncbi:hypothetical protein [Muricoccus vinaceus]|uniref:Uncharacterized protein n=1 Tax=Muricoccus vinaceus TaxID=424704 RepID=A0ABV6J3T5_9PROT
MSPARRGLLAAIGGAAVAAPALASTQRIGRVEQLVRRLPALDQAAQAAEDRWMACKGPEAEKDHIRSQWNEATIIVFDTEDAALEAEPETIMDALLVIALASTHADRAADFDTNYGDTAERLMRAARHNRRAADFLAAATGHDLQAVLGNQCTLRREVA